MSKQKYTMGMVRVLKALARAYPEGMTRSQLQDAGLAGSGLTNGAAEAEMGIGSGNNSPRSLINDGLVRMVVEDHSCRGGHNRVHVYYLTPRGRVVADNLITSKNRKEEHRIPHELLDPIVKEMKKTRVLGLEYWPEDDIRSIRDRCGSDWAHVPLADVRKQIENRRKAGAFKDTDQDNWPDWYLLYRESEHWHKVEGQALSQWMGNCALNPSHSEGIGVYHRTFDGLYNELAEAGDVIPLCQKCRARNAKSMPAIPVKEPGMVE